MVDVVSISKEHEKTISEIISDFQKRNIAVDRAGYHDVYKNITKFLRETNNFAFDEEKLFLTMKADLRIYFPKLKIVDLDVKTSNRKDTGRFAIEIWHLLIALKDPFKKFFCFVINDKKILLEPDKCKNFSQMIFCPEDRWTTTDNNLQKEILKKSLDNPSFKTIIWNRQVSSGDYFFLITEKYIKENGLRYEDLLEDKYPERIESSLLVENKKNNSKETTSNPYFPPGEYKRLFGKEFTLEFFDHLKELNNPDVVACFMSKKFLKKNFEDLEESQLPVA